MAFAATQGRNAPLAGINITPLVDVMLVLLVIFMIAAPIMTQSLVLKLPSGPSPLTKTQTLHLNIEAGEVYSLDGLAVSPAQLTERFAHAVASSEQPVALELGANPDAEYESVTRAMTLARNAGIESINLRQH